MKHKIELLAPGGDIDSIKAAILAGADAVYCGLDKFNARNRAANISFDKAKVLVEPISSIMIDIDDFKKINDNLGHHTGDLVLKRLSKVCSETLGDNHILGRFGGEEFIVLLPNTPFKEAEIIGECLRSAIENNPLIIRKSDSIAITSSLGVACITPTVEHLDFLFISADKAMYQAKALGKNKVISINLDSKTMK